MARQSSAFCRQRASSCSQVRDVSSSSDPLITTTFANRRCRNSRPPPSPEVNFATESHSQTWHTLVIFVLCMVLNPDAQRKRQEEISRVIGSARLPDFSDRDSLPYVECIMKETMRYGSSTAHYVNLTNNDRRWYPVVANGLPHVSLADEIYEGMLIPAGSTVIANARYAGVISDHFAHQQPCRAMTLDETKFSEPHRFIPERFLAKPEGRGEVLPESVVFGWGRRSVPR